MDPSNYPELFPVIQRHCWLNHAAISAWPAPVIAAAQAFVNENRDQGALDYEAWMEKEDGLRHSLAELINAPSPDDISLLRNTSEGLNIIAQGVLWQTGDEIVFPSNEFPSNALPWQWLSKVGVRPRPTNLLHADDPTQALIEAIEPKTRMVAVSAVQFDTGIRLNLQKIGEACRQNHTIFCVDAIQHLGALALDVQHIGADFVVSGSHKWLMGPEGIGFLWSKADTRKEMQVALPGWRMYEDPFDFNRHDWTPTPSGRRFETGTVNMFGIHGLAAAVDLLIKLDPKQTGEALLDKTDHLMAELLNMPAIDVVTPHAREQRAGIVCFRAERLDAECIVNELAKENIHVAKRGDKIRVSPHFYTPIEQLEKFLQWVRDQKRRNTCAA